jgi:DNA topoisomerase-1
MGKSLVIVESPTKARTIARFVGDDYIVESSIGHIRDLPESARDIPSEVKKEPWARLGIDVAHDFKPLYIVPPDKQEQVSKLKRLLKGADRLYLATDEDREGESISWHLREVLRPTIPTHRLVFHEITREAIGHALAHPRDIDERLVRAQETRRVLDRLYGYEVSPVLWRKIAPALSAGRVQSVAVRLIVNRERERLKFRQAAWWDLEGQFAAQDPARAGEAFEATLIALDGKRLVSGKDFDDATGALAADKADRPPLVHLDEAGAQALVQRLEQAQWSVARVERRPYTTQPPAPFTTSTLQQEANRKLGTSSRDTMRLAQGLYERGYITYMRTDSTTLSEQALAAARSQIGALYGADYLPPQARQYTARVKNAQEAHEAIRPAGEAFRTPDAVRRELEPREWKLYDMIWKRTVASQMKDARGQRVLLEVEGGGAVFQATGKTIEFPGYLRAYVEGSDDPEAELGDQERLLPDLALGEPVRCRGLAPQEHRTQPPARYSEAALIKELERQGIGRPSTYASIIDTIIRREYVSRKGKQLVPTFTAFAVVRLLEQFFTHLVDVDFTAQMEEALDAISRGEQESLPYLRRFYHGHGDLPGLETMVKAEIDPRLACTIPLGEEDRQHPIAVRIGRFGPYLQRDDERAPLPVDITPDELTLERADELLRRGSEPDVLGTDPETGRTVYLKNGRYGPYVQLGEQDDADRKMKSLLPGMVPEQVTLEDALRALSLPRSLGADPETGEDVQVDLGRYGPYVRRGKDTRSLSSAEALFTTTLEEARAILAQPRSFRRGPAVLREVGKHPQSEAPINLMDGRFGPYVTDGELNASVPRGEDAAALTLERALELLAERAAKGPPAKGRRRAAAKSAGRTAGRTAGKTAAARKTAAKKTTARKAAAKKSPARTAAAKKSAGKKSVAKKAAAKQSPARQGAARKSTAKNSPRKASQA